MRMHSILKKKVYPQTVKHPYKNKAPQILPSKYGMPGPKKA
jgi:hypothetical protein